MKLVKEMMREFHEGGVSEDCANMRRMAERVSCYRIRGYACHAAFIEERCRSPACPIPSWK